MKDTVARYATCVRALVIENEKILLVNEKKESIWETPGGKVEISDKNLISALKREILEETGYESEVFEVLDVNEMDWHGKKMIFIIYRCKIGKKVSMPDLDIAGIKWFSKEEIKKMLKQKKVDGHDINVFKMLVEGKI